MSDNDRDHLKSARESWKVLVFVFGPLLAISAIFWVATMLIVGSQ